MLVLTRSKGRRVVINGELVITVIDVDKFGCVRLGFTGPESYIIDREEIHARKIKEQNCVALSV